MKIVQSLDGPTIAFVRSGSGPPLILIPGLPHSQLAILPGQDHFAMLEAPELLVDELISFLTAPE